MIKVTEEAQNFWGATKEGALQIQEAIKENWDRQLRETPSNYEMRAYLYGIKDGIEMLLELGNTILQDRKNNLYN